MAFKNDGKETKPAEEPNEQSFRGGQKDTDVSKACEPKQQT